MKKTIRSLSLYLVGGLLVGAVGLVLLLSGRAATPTASVETESGSRSASGQAKLLSDNTASNNGAVRFIAPSTTPVSAKFTIALLPDQQRQVNYSPQTFRDSMQWLVDEKNTQTKFKNLSYAIQVGDLQDWDTSSDPSSVHYQSGHTAHDQYDDAKSGLNILKAGSLPIALTTGNHDSQINCPGGGGCSPQEYNTSIAGNAMRDTSTWNMAKYYAPASIGLPASNSTTAAAGVYEVGKSDNAYRTFNAGGLQWMIVNLEFMPRPGAVAWAGQAIAGHPHHNVIISTHAYLTPSTKAGICNSGFNDGNHSYVAAEDYAPSTLSTKLVKKYANVRFVVSGHTGSNGCLVEQGVNGNKIYDFMDCYHQTYSNPLRFLEFDTSANQVKSTVYDPIGGVTFTNASNANGTTYASIIPPITNIDWVR